jgi:hypothetical protein
MHFPVTKINVFGVKKFHSKRKVLIKPKRAYHEMYQIHLYDGGDALKIILVGDLVLINILTS